MITSKTPMTVIHHSADWDGIFCREIARKFLPPDTEFIGWDYKDPKIQFPAEGTVYVFDLSPDCFTSLLTDEQTLRLIWIDHHATAIAKYDGWVHEPAGKDSFGVHYSEYWRREHESRTTQPPTIPGYRIDGVAACRLAWQYFTFFDGKPNKRPISPTLPDKQHYIDRVVSEPLAVRLAGEYDIWDKRDPAAELFQHGLRSQELTRQTWNDLFSGAPQTVRRLLKQGELLQYARAQEYADVITQQGFDLEFEGLKFLACNSHELDIRSHLFEAGINPEHDALLGFTYNGKSKDWRISMYHAPGKEHHDLSVIAKKHGGGGHRGACGCRMAKLPFLP